MAHIGVTSHQFPAIGEVSNMKIHYLSGVFVAVVAMVVVAAPRGNDNHHTRGHLAEVRSAPGVSKNPWLPPQVPSVRVKRRPMGDMVVHMVSRVVMTTFMVVAYAGAATAINASANAMGFHDVFEHSGSHITGFIWRISPIIDKVLGY